MLRPDLDPAFIALAESGLVFDALVHPRHLPNLLKRLSQHPDMRVVIDHAAKPHIRDRKIEPWASDLARIARDTQALCKVSGMVTEAAADWQVEDIRPYFDCVLEAFGPARMVFGSDWPVVNLAGSYERWLATAETLAASLSAAEKAALFGGNAISLYKLDAPGRLQRAGAAA
jgi:L-fuconolactonase